MSDFVRQLLRSLNSHVCNSPARARIRAAIFRNPADFADAATVAGLTREDLQRLPGIGPGAARAFLEWRGEYLAALAPAPPPASQPNSIAGYSLLPATVHSVTVAPPQITLRYDPAFETAFLDLVAAGDVVLIRTEMKATDGPNP